MEALKFALSFEPTFRTLNWHTHSWDANGESISLLGLSRNTQKAVSRSLSVVNSGKYSRKCFQKYLMRLNARDNNQPVSLESLVKRFRMKMCDWGCC